MNFGYGDPLQMPLPLGPPKTWAEAEERVRWLLQHLIAGEKALLYRMLYASGLRLEWCLDTERKARAAMGGTP
jgi:hypothetical protein